MNTENKSPVIALTKSRFTLSLDCPTKLYYATNPGYKSTLEDDDFLQALAKGGMQVGELAKLYYPGGHDIHTLDKKQALSETRELMQKESVTIYEAAIQANGCFIRVDVLEKKSDRINLIEVKSKSWDPEESFVTKAGDRILSGWQPYLFDVAFQTWVTRHAYPGLYIKPFLMLIDKTRSSTVDGLHQNFRVVEEEDRHVVKVKEGVGPDDMGEQILRPVPVADWVEMILGGYGREACHEAEASGFSRWVEILTDHLAANRKYPVRIGQKCKACEFRISRDKLDEGEKSGFEECWSEALGWTDEDFEQPHVFDVWNWRNSQELLDQGICRMADMVSGSLPADPDRVYEGSSCDRPGRQTVQIMKMTGCHPPDEMVLSGLFREMENWRWPLHFIDFEAVLPAIPFHKGRRPYEFIPFQFSCHTVFENGQVEHSADWIETRPGVFPSFEFVRRLKACLEGDSGTVFRYHNFENTVLNKVAGQLLEERPDDAQELIDWITTMTKGGEREMVDQFRLIMEYYYTPLMGGSNSIKYVLPAVMTESPRLKQIYSQPYSGLYIKDKIFYREDERTGRAISPYKLLDPVGYGLTDYEVTDNSSSEHGVSKYGLPDNETADELVSGMENGSAAITEGGSAMMAWSRLQFDDLPDAERAAILQSLYEYCELDTLAMVMIHQHWEELREG